MLLSFKNKTKTNHNDPEMGIVVTANESNITVNTTPLIELPGLKNAIKKSQEHFSLPPISSSLLVKGTTAAVNLATDIYVLSAYGASIDEEVNEDMANIAVGANVLNIILSNGLQMGAFIKEQQRIQNLQREFLGSILNLITRCYFNKEDFCKDLEAPFDVSKIMIFLYENGTANFTLSIPGADFTLLDNSFTASCGKAFVLAVGSSLIATGLSISHKLEYLIFSSNLQINNAFRMGTSIAANAPTVDVAGSLLEWSKSQNSKMLETIAKVINVVYLEKNSLGDIPVTLVMTLSDYISKDDISKILEMRDEARKSLPSFRPTIMG